MRTRRPRARLGAARETLPGDSISIPKPLSSSSMSQTGSSNSSSLSSSDDSLARVSTHAPDRNMFSTAFASSTPRVAPAASLSASRRGSSAIAPLAVKCRGRTRVSSRCRHLVRTRARTSPTTPSRFARDLTATSDPTPAIPIPFIPLDRPAHVSPSVFSASSSPSSTHQDFSLGKLAKKVQGSIPVVSLVSKLLSPEGRRLRHPFLQRVLPRESSTPPAAPISARPSLSSATSP